MCFGLSTEVCVAISTPAFCATDSMSRSFSLPLQGLSADQKMRSPAGCGSVLSYLHTACPAVGWVTCSDTLTGQFWGWRKLQELTLQDWKLTGQMAGGHCRTGDCRTDFRIPGPKILRSAANKRRESSVSSKSVRFRSSRLQNTRRFCVICDVWPHERRRCKFAGQNTMTYTRFANSSSRNTSINSHSLGVVPRFSPSMSSPANSVHPAPDRKRVTYSLVSIR